MFVHYRTKSLILKKVDRAEHDQLFTIYTRDFGKIKVLGRGIRKISSKLRSGADLFYLTEIEFIQGKIHKTLTDAILIDKFNNLRRSLARLNIASEISELLDKLIYNQQPEEKIWNLLMEVFQQLNQPKFKNAYLKLIYYYFFWRLVSILGYLPELFQCTMCNQKLKPDKLYFNFPEGGIICHNCFEKEKKGHKMTPATVKIIRALSAKEWSAVKRIKIEEKHLKPLEVISQKYLSFILEGIS